MSLRQQFLTLILCCLDGSLLPGPASILCLQKGFPGPQQEACKKYLLTSRNVTGIPEAIMAEARP